MASRRTGNSKWPNLIYLSLAAIFVVGCASASTQPSLSTAELVGTWNGSEGSMTFSLDHAFGGQELKLNSVSGLGCNKVSGRGTWQFLSPQGASGPRLTSFRRGNVIGLVFDGDLSSCGFELTTWRSGNSVALCLYSDPDSPCITPLFKPLHA
jgi:hypothetical protein